MKKKDEPTKTQKIIMVTIVILLFLIVFLGSTKVDNRRAALIQAKKGACLNLGYAEDYEHNFQNGIDYCIRYDQALPVRFICEDNCIAVPIVQKTSIGEKQ